MSIPGSIPDADTRPTIAGDLGRCALWVLWQSIRLPLFLFLLVLEPVVTFVLGALALLGVLTALFWKFFGPPNFPAAPHEHALILGYYSVHTSPDALRNGEAHILSIKGRLIQEGRLD
jgi:hypothetical protein